MEWFWPKYIMFQLKRYRGVIFDCTQDWYKVWKKNWLVLPKIDMRNLTNFHQSTCLESLWIGTLMASICLKLKMYELKIYRRAMRHYKKEWSKTWREIDLSVQNWHEEFYKFRRANLKFSKFCFNGLLLTKVYVWTKKSIEKLFFMALNIDTKVEGGMTCAFKNDMKNLANCHQNMFESLKIRTLMGSFYPK